LFTGCGGWEWGAKQLGYHPLWGVEFNKAYAQGYGNNFPTGTLIPGDVRKVDPDPLEIPDVLFVSPPCQGHSAGRKRGNVVTRGDEEVGVECLKFVDSFMRRHKAPAVLIENVKGYRSHEAYLEIIRGLKKRGFTVSDGLFNASDYGTPSDRIRLLAWATLSPLGERAAGNMEKLVVKKKADWWEAVKDLVDTMPPADLAPWQEYHSNLVPPESWPVLIGGIPVDYKVDEVTGRKVWREAGRPAPTIVKQKAQSGARIALNPYDVRRITPRFAARWMGFSDDFWLPPGIVAGFDVVGNAVPPPLAVAALKAMGLR
jgi:DNA (cytosine-5)-methyltransferase 1